MLCALDCSCDTRRYGQADGNVARIAWFCSMQAIVLPRLAKMFITLPKAISGQKRVSRNHDVTIYRWITVSCKRGAIFRSKCDAATLR